MHWGVRLIFLIILFSSEVFATSNILNISNKVESILAPTTHDSTRKALAADIIALNPTDALTHQKLATVFNEHTQEKQTLRNTVANILGELHTPYPEVQRAMLSAYLDDSEALSEYVFAFAKIAKAKKTDSTIEWALAQHSINTENALRQLKAATLLESIAEYSPLHSETVYAVLRTLHSQPVDISGILLTALLKHYENSLQPKKYQATLKMLAAHPVPSHKAEAVRETLVGIEKRLLTRLEASDILNGALLSQDPHVYNAAADVATHLKPADYTSVKVLLTLLNSDDLLKSLFAANILVQTTSDEELFDYTLNLAAKNIMDENPYIRSAAYETLGNGLNMHLAKNGFYAFRNYHDHFMLLMDGVQPNQSEENVRLTTVQKIQDLLLSFDVHLPQKLFEAPNLHQLKLDLFANLTHLLVNLAEHDPSHKVKIAAAQASRKITTLLEALETHKLCALYLKAN